MNLVQYDFDATWLAPAENGNNLPYYLWPEELYLKKHETKLFGTIIVSKASVMGCIESGQYEFERFGSTCNCCIV